MSQPPRFQTLVCSPTALLQDLTPSKALAAFTGVPHFRSGGMWHNSRPENGVRRHVSHLNLNFQYEG